MLAHEWAPKTATGLVAEMEEPERSPVLDTTGSACPFDSVVVQVSPGALPEVVAAALVIVTSVSSSVANTANSENMVSASRPGAFHARAR